MLDFDSAAHTGRQYSYCTYGIAVSEIELDTLTGQHKLLETEILMDVGRSLNPRIVDEKYKKRCHHELKPDKTQLYATLKLL